MSDRCTTHCPRKQNIKLKEVLSSLAGTQVAVIIPGGVVKGAINSVTNRSFRVGQVEILFETSWYFAIPPLRGALPFTAVVSVEELNAVSGRLIRLGKDFVIVRSSGIPLKGKFVLIPLNNFTHVTCERDDEE